MRVIMTTARFWPQLGGVETHCLELGRRLVEAGFELTVAATDASGTLPARDEIGGIDVRRFPAYPARSDLYISPRLAQFVAGSGADLVHCQGFHTFVSPLAMFAALARDLPYVVTLHTGGHSSRARTLVRPIQAALLGPLVRRARAVIAVSRWEAAHMGGRLGTRPERLAIIPNGADLPGIGDLPPEPGLIVSPGRLERYKGHHRVIEALPFVIQSHPDAHLRLLGDGPDAAKLRERSDRLGVADRVEIAAERDRRAVAGVLGRAQVVVSLSEYESHGLAILEALSLGRPTVVAVNSALTELVDAGLARGVKPAASAEQIADAIVEAMTAPPPASRPALPSWDACAAETGELYRSVVRAR
jgi:glycosyltransferase involved in cell wall biosynthesis